MELKTNYYYFNGALSEADCEKIVTRGKEEIEKTKIEGRETKASTFGGNDKFSQERIGNTVKPKNEKTNADLREEGNISDFYVRDSEIAWLNDQWIYDLIIPYVEEANDKAGWQWEFDCAESMQFTRYKNSGFYSWHRDGGSDNYAKYRKYIHGISPDPLNEFGEIPQTFSDPNRNWLKYTTIQNHVGKIRKLSVTVNLTNPIEYEGGDLMFDFSKHDPVEQFHTCTAAREKGSIIVFPSFMPHCVTPITKGTRTSLVIWFLGEPFK